MILAEHRRCIVSENPDFIQFAPGATIAEIVAAFEKAPEFETHGVVYLHYPSRKAIGPSLRVQSDHCVEVSRDKWHRVRPSDGTAVFISVVPQGDGGKQTLGLIASLALIALVTIVNPSATLMLTGALGPIGAGVAAAGAAATPAGGAVHLNLLRSLSSMTRAR